MYKKDYDKWFILKKEINSHTKQSFYVNEGEIWWCAVGVNIGREIDGKNQLLERPVLILKKYPNSCYLVVPLTTNPRVHPFAFPIILDGKECKAIISQIKVVSKERLLRLMVRMSEKKLKQIRNIVKQSL